MSKFNKNALAVCEINEDSVEVKIFTLAINPDFVYWENLSQKINSSIKTLSSNYIWHRDELKVYLPILDSIDGIPMHLTSTVCFGDNIEDEWYIVYLLMEISKIYKDLIIQILDSDGDFLLIEAANYLPSWANPETTENRVFIFNNTIHIIPPQLADLKNKIELKDALQILSKFAEETKVSIEIEEAIKTKVGPYPQKIKEHFHTAVVNLPLDIAAVLTTQPSLISPLVTAYCNHDVIDAKSCKTLHYTDYVSTEVKFTKCLYAMLMHSKLLKNVKHNFATTNNKRDIIGIKLTCGFQMIMNQLSKDVFCSKEYLKYEKNLKDNGYFKENLEGSMEYNKLLKMARQYYLDIECPINSYVSKEISELMATDTFLHYKQAVKNNKNLKEDNDDWLSINPSELNSLLNDRYGNQIKCNTGDVVTPETITSKLTDFLKQSSDFEGIESQRIDDAENDTINFEADQFVHCLEKMMNLLSSEKIELPNDDSDVSSESDLSDNFNDNSELDKELSGKLYSFEEGTSNSKRVVFNLTQSIKEEGSSGPSSNLLATIGLNKTDLLDSDDD